MTKEANAGTKFPPKKDDENKMHTIKEETERANELTTKNKKKRIKQIHLKMFFLCLLRSLHLP